jgi:hypothetical protein
MATRPERRAENPVLRRTKILETRVYYLDLACMIRIAALQHHCLKMA